MAGRSCAARQGAALVFVALVVAACDEPPVRHMAQTHPAETAAPVDQVLQGELAEGKDLAFGLPVPRRMQVAARPPGAVLAMGDVPAERVANYVRARVDAERIETGPAKTVFFNARVKKAPEGLVRVEVASRGASTQLVVHDETRPPSKPGLSEEERWKEVGMKPDGTPLDPKHLQ